MKQTFIFFFETNIHAVAWIKYVTKQSEYEYHNVSLG